MLLPDVQRPGRRLTTLLAFAAFSTLAGCVTTDDDGYGNGNDTARPPCNYPCTQPNVEPPRKTAVSATPKVKRKT